MKREWIRTAACCCLLSLVAAAQAQIYKVVDKDGNVIYTDQAPADGSEPMDLPELSVVETEPAPQPPETAGEGEIAEEEAPAELTPRDLRRMYRDFALTSPQAEETFWGTDNTVVVSWNSATPLQPGMSVRLVLNGAPQGNYTQPPVALTLDRGEHTVAAELRDPRGRRLIATEPVTVYVHQYSANFNRPRNP